MAKKKKTRKAKTRKAKTKRTFSKAQKFQDRRPPEKRGIAWSKTFVLIIVIATIVGLAGAVIIPSLAPRRLRILNRPPASQSTPSHPPGHQPVQGR